MRISGKLVVTLNLLVLVAPTLEQLTAPPTMITGIGLMIRVLLLVFLSWKFFTDSKVWVFCMATLSLLKAGATWWVIHRHAHDGTLTLFYVGEKFISHFQAMLIFVILAAASSVASCFLAFTTPSKQPKQAPEPTCLARGSA